MKNNSAWLAQSSRSAALGKTGRLSVHIVVCTTTCDPKDLSRELPVFSVVQSCTVQPITTDSAREFQIPSNVGLKTQNLSENFMKYSNVSLKILNRSNVSVITDIPPPT